MPPAARVGSGATPLVTTVRGHAGPGSVRQRSPSVTQPQSWAQQAAHVSGTLPRRDGTLLVLTPLVGPLGAGPLARHPAKVPLGPVALPTGGAARGPLAPPGGWGAPGSVARWALEQDFREAWWGVSPEGSRLWWTAGGH